MSQSPCLYQQVKNHICGKRNWFDLPSPCIACCTDVTVDTIRHICWKYTSKTCTKHKLAWFSTCSHFAHLQLPLLEILVHMYLFKEQSSFQVGFFIFCPIRLKLGRHTQNQILRCFCSWHFIKKINSFDWIKIFYLLGKCVPCNF